MITREEAAKHVSYDPTTGLLAWVGAGKGRRVGKTAGGRASDGYVLHQRPPLSRPQARLVDGS